MMSFDSYVDSNEDGFTLVEVAIASSLFAMILLAAGQAMLGSNQTMDLQQQRVNAAEDCSSLLKNMRNTRDDAPFGTFPASITDVWAPNAVLTADTDPAIVNVQGASITVSYVDPVATPLEVTLLYSWNTLDGKTIRLTMGTVLVGN